MSEYFVKVFKRLSAESAISDKARSARHRLIRNNIDTLIEVVESAKSLTNEVSGMFSIAEYEIKKAIGPTNVQLVITRLVETKEALAKLEELR